MRQSPWFGLGGLLCFACNDTVWRLFLHREKEWSRAGRN
jgi:hypothetical protein